MKRLHRKDLYCWSKFHEPLNIDFNSVLWVRPGGNVIIDPLPPSDHDTAHLRELGGAAIIVITNSMHLRAGLELKQLAGTRLLAPSAEREKFANDGALKDGDEIVPGLVVRELQGSKTPGELALILEDTTLITGDLVRAHRANSLMLLSPEQKLADKGAAVQSMKRVLELHPRIETILVGDGWHLFSEGHRRLNDLLSAS